MDKNQFEFERAFNFFNRALFDDGLPGLIITLQRKKNCRGYFSPDRFKAKDGDAKAHELALNPDTFDRDDRLLLSTLAHEMCHVWQEVHGKPSRNGYHNKQWADQMERVGLMPSDTGEEGGKRTGQKMTHYVAPGGAFDQAAGKLIADGFKINWASFNNGPAADKKKNKVKYTCDGCGQNAWAKPGAKLACGVCEVALEAEEGG